MHRIGRSVNWQFHFSTLSIYLQKRCYPKSITTDNGTDFVSAQWELSEALQKLDKPRIKDDLNEGYITLTFNLSSASWMGGAMDSMVKIANKALKSIIVIMIDIKRC